MSTRETQERIVEKAIELFNRRGTRAISTNRIADECDISRGNLHYHFRTKDELVRTIFQMIESEMNESWYEDHLHPNMEWMHMMFERQMQLLWKYRFFYREQNSLIQNDESLKLLFMDARRKRVKEVRAFFEALVEEGLMDFGGNKEELESNLLISWLISDQWLPYLDINDIELNQKSIEEGFELIFVLLRPYFTVRALSEHQSLLQRAKADNIAQLSV